VSNWDALNAQIVVCTRCPRLVAYRERVDQQKRAQYRDWAYWGKPVPNFGEPTARLLIVGLAPAAHGGNRTGRIFTGDASGDFLFAALHQTGFCNQPTSVHRDDGLQLYDVTITAAVHCAPPDNTPTPDEQRACFPYLQATYRLMPNLRGLLALGQIAFNACVRLARAENLLPEGVRPHFRHGAVYPLAARAVPRRELPPQRTQHLHETAHARDDDRPTAAGTRTAGGGRYRDASRFWGLSRARRLSYTVWSS
jgi:uracil-DNA glycosylase family 4